MSSNRSEFLFQVVEEDGCPTIRFPAGTTLSEANAEEFARGVLALGEGKERPHVMVDLGGVGMLTSAILARLVALNAHLRASGGRLTLFNVNPTVHQVFKVTRLDTVLDVRALDNPLPV